MNTLLFIVFLVFVAVFLRRSGFFSGDRGKTLGP